jgi:hypothetical protein
MLGRGTGHSQGWHNTEEGARTSMPQVGFEPTSTVFERLNIMRILHRAATGEGLLSLSTRIKSCALKITQILVLNPPEFSFTYRSF